MLIMPASRFSQLIEEQLHNMNNAPDRDGRIRAILQFIGAQLCDCAEKTIDEEMASINGASLISPIKDLEDSSYHSYNCARRNAYANFTGEQKQVLRGLVQHTVFDLLSGVLGTLFGEFMSENLSIRLRPKAVPDFEFALDKFDPRDLGFMDIPDILKACSKYEY